MILSFSAAASRMPMLGAAVTMASCAQPYQLPQAGQGAVVLLPPPINSIQYWDNGEDCSDITRLSGDANPFNRSDRSLVVPTDHRVAINVVSARGLSACGIILSAQFQPGRTYNVEMSLGSSECTAKVMDVTGRTAVVATSIGVRQMKHAGLASCVPAR